MKRPGRDKTLFQCLFLNPRPRGLGRPTAPYTQAALVLLDAVRQAVAADHTAGNTLADVAAVLDVSEDTAARR
ncbi:hypothetical protein PUR49_01115 [Streptomyces sp. BE147]|uniref:hypothetical protein n=1 Tax=Streptomyces sp. BE147 TaxID=3002524 RepID=UPI002E771C6F|nr:hypothetical protein [Streptomyces sp. BE147]MEE1735152.1 hypothetical protein [Streptomyces sp. BE147]